MIEQLSGKLLAATAAAANAGENAPTFSWKRGDATALTVTQNWKDSTGKDQSTAMTVKRVP